MAKLVAVRNRGRKKEALRLEAAVLAAQVGPYSAEKADLTIEVAPPKRKGGKADTLEVTFPKGTVSIPVGLTAGKKEENAREQLRLAASDAGKRVSIRSATYTMDGSDAEHIAWFYVPAKPKAEPKAEPKAAPKGRAKR